MGRRKKGSTLKAPKFEGQVEALPKPTKSPSSLLLTTILYSLFLFSLFVSSSTMAGMSNTGGDILRVVVVQGKHLVVRDFNSSDPYVILKLGTQIAKTKVINSCLNPVWNQEFTFSLIQPPQTLHLEVFDKDLFKADDKMGHAHLNIQPLTSAARLMEVLKVSSGETKLRKVVPDSDNCLVRESCISCVNGDVVQDVWLRLNGVESGEIELKLILTNCSLIVH